jgi:ribulose-5-phosphate 4-epimerase/fuculose-1-phosphate aldolase
MEMNKILNESLSDEEIKLQLANAYRLLAHLGMDDLTYTHLSARPPGKDYYFIYPFGCLFSEVTPELLLTVSLEGKVLKGSEYQYNKTGYVIHSAIYRARKDVSAVFHLHTIAGVAVSAMAAGLLPISQFSFHFYNRLSYHEYNSLALDADAHGNKMAEDLGNNFAMILRNHGTLTCGTTIQQAFFNIYYLEEACKVQCKVLGSGQPLHLPSAEICEKAAKDMRAFEPDLGQRDWLALCRKYQLSNKKVTCSLKSEPACVD